MNKRVIVSSVMNEHAIIESNVIPNEEVGAIQTFVSLANQLGFTFECEVSDTEDELETYNLTVDGESRTTDREEAATIMRELRGTEVTPMKLSAYPADEEC
jgi:hypothetical protein